MADKRSNFFANQRMHTAADVADDKVKGYGHLREDAHDYLDKNDLSLRARLRNPERSWTEFNRDANESDMAADKFPMFSKGGMVRKHGSPTNCGSLCRDTKTLRK